MYTQKSLNFATSQNIGVGLGRFRENAIKEGLFFEGTYAA